MSTFLLFRRLVGQAPSDLTCHQQLRPNAVGPSTTAEVEGVSPASNWEVQPGDWERALALQAWWHTGSHST